MLVENPVHGEGFDKHIGLANGLDVEIVVIVPTFRHSVFVADAVDSILAQETAHVVRVVIVDDGCPYDETQRIATVLAAAYPDRVEYIRRRNGGLSAARNTGIDYALSRWPSLRAIYFLDADNMIEPKALDRAYSLLMSDPSIGWVYPDIIFFGSEDTYWDYRGPYSILRHLKSNLSEAASMVRREVFERGCRYDETMRLGYEDWEFWWQCIDAGFVGRHVPFFGLRYRKRPESMLSETTREHEGVMLYMRRKHNSLFRAKRLFEFYGPRYGILMEGAQVKLCKDLRDRGEMIEASSLVDRVTAAHQQPYLHCAPPYLIAASKLSLDLLVRLRLDRFVLWWIEHQFFIDSAVHVAAIQIVVDSSFTEIAVRPLEHGSWPPFGKCVHLMAFQPRILKECVSDPNLGWVDSLLSSHAYPTTVILRIELPAAYSSEEIMPDVIYRWFELFRQLQSAQKRLPSSLPMSKHRSIPPCVDDGQIASELLGCGPLFFLPKDNKYDIAFVLPIMSFGGVEKVVLHIAEQFHRKGWRCHMLVLAKQALIGEYWLSIFDSVNFYYEDSFYQWSIDSQYLGTTYPKWVADGDPRSLEGLLLGMDAVVNFHAAALHKILHKLRKSGVVTAASLHVNDLSLFGREGGHLPLALGYEHVYDLFAPCSQTLLDQCNGLGVPHDKLVLVRNAPAHTIAANEIAGVLARRRTRNGAGRKLNVLFLGRLDRQKGIDRVAATLRKSRDLNLPISWRIVGSSIADAADATVLRELSDFIEPAVHDSQELTELYEWADVLFMPSHWEGLPLTIMEAARLGVVPVASYVGAIPEIVEHQKTGLLLDNSPCEEFVASAVTAFCALVNDQALLASLSRQASDAMTRTWEAGCDEFIERLGTMVASRSKRCEPPRVCRRPQLT